MIKGIDVSTYQKNVDYKKAKAAGIDFVIIRAGYGKLASQKDTEFEKHYKNAKAAGLAVGAYWYSYATTVAEAKQEADVCLQIIKGKQFEYPIWYDIEEKRTFNTGLTNEIAAAFLQKIEKAGYFGGIYISRSPAQTYLSTSTRNRYALWLAEYSSKLNYTGQYGMWQFSGSGKISGINGTVDLDYSYTDYKKVITSRGLNGFKKSASDESKAVTPKTLEQRVTDLEKRVSALEKK